MYEKPMSTGALVAVLLFSIALSGLLGYWGGRIARGKGYEFWIGFVAGFFGGLIGILIIYVIPEKRRTMPPPSYYRQPMFQGLPPEQPQYPPAQPPGRTKACQNCGYLAEGSAEFCTYCGSRLPVPPPLPGGTPGAAK